MPAATASQIKRMQPHYMRSAASEHGFARWTPAQDERLVNAVEQIKVSHARRWTVIAEVVGEGKTPAACYQHFHRVLSPQIRKGPWTKQEVAIFVALVVEFGPHYGWSRLARAFPGRTGSQLRTRHRVIRESTTQRYAVERNVLRGYLPCSELYRFMQPGQLSAACNAVASRFSVAEVAARIAQSRESSRSLPRSRLPIVSQTSFPSSVAGGSSSSSDTRSCGSDVECASDSTLSTSDCKADSATDGTGSSITCDVNDSLFAALHASIMNGSIGHYAAPAGTAFGSNADDVMDAEDVDVLPYASPVHFEVDWSECRSEDMEHMTSATLLPSVLLRWNECE